MLEKHPEVQKSEDLLREYKSGDRETWSKNFIEDREFRLGEQFSEDVKASYQNKGMMAASINETLPAIDQVIADLTSNNPRFDAVAIEDSDVKVASYVARLFDWIFYISKGQVKVERHTRDFCEGGVGVFFTYPDYNTDDGKPELKITDIDPIHVYIDPSSKEPDSSDASNIILSNIISEDKIGTEYDFNLTDAEQEKSDEYSRQRAETQGQIIFASKPASPKYYRTIERFTKVKIKRYHVYHEEVGFNRTFEEKSDYEAWAQEPAIIQIELGSESYVIDDQEVKSFISIMETIGDTYHLVEDQYGNKQFVPGVEDGSPYTIPNSTVKLQKVTKGDLVEQGIIEYDEPKVTRIRRVFSIGGKLVVNEILPISNYPVVTSMLHHNRNPFATGDIRLIKPLQEQLNVLDSRIQSYLKMITRLRAFVNKGGALKKQLDKRGDPEDMDVYEVDLEVDGSGVVFPQYPQLPAGVMQQRENLIRQIQRIIGAYSFQDGEVVSAPRTASGTSQIDEFMRRRSAYKKRKIEASLQQLATVMAEYIPHIYTEKKLIRLILPNHKKPMETIINGETEQDGQIKQLNNVTDVKLDVRIIADSTLPSSRSQERAELLRAYELNMLKNPKWWILKSDFEDIDMILEQEDLVTQMQGAIQQLESTIKDLEGQLQTKSREVIQANEKVAIKDTEVKLDKAASKVEARTILHGQRLTDLEKSSKEAIKKEKQNG